MLSEDLKKMIVIYFFYFEVGKEVWNHHYKIEDILQRLLSLKVVTNRWQVAAKNYIYYSACWFGYICYISRQEQEITKSGL
jgi:hypothetical protein